MRGQKKTTLQLLSWLSISVWLGCADLQEEVEPIVDTALAVRGEQDEVSMPEVEQEQEMREQPVEAQRDESSASTDPSPIDRRVCLMDLPDNVLEQILQHVPLADAQRLTRVNHRIRVLVHGMAHAVSRWDRPHLNLSREVKPKDRPPLLDQKNRKGILNCFSIKNKISSPLIEKTAISVLNLRGRHDLTLEDFKAIANTPIRILDLRGARVPAAGLRLLAYSPMAKSIQQLKLSHAYFAGAQTGDDRTKWKSQWMEAALLLVDAPIAEKTLGGNERAV